MKREYEERQNRLKRLKGKVIIIFGAGNWGKSAYRALDSAHIVVKGFCDNNVSIWGQKIGDAIIYNPTEAIMQFPDVIYVIANKMHSQEIEDQLSALGINRDYIFIYEES